MFFKRFSLVVLLLIFCTVSYAQKEAIVLRNVWSNELNSYNPQTYIDNLLAAFADALAVKKVVEEAGSLQTDMNELDWNKKIKDKIKLKSISGNNAFYISMQTELRLPLINVTKLFFKNPVTSSKLIFSYHLFNSAGVELLADTIVNRGCYSKAIDKDGSKNFYDSYKSFLDDMQCHADAIKKSLQEKQLYKKKIPLLNL